MFKTRIAFSLLTLGLLASMPMPVLAQGKPLPAKVKAKAEAEETEGGAAFASTKFAGNGLFDGGTQAESLGQANVRAQQASTILVKGCVTNAEVSTAFARLVAPSLDAMGLVQMTDQEIQATKKKHYKCWGPMVSMVADHALIYCPKDGAALQKWVDKIVWLGSRENGPIKGVVSKLYLVVIPTDITFNDTGASFEPMVQVLGSWHNVVGSTDYSPYANAISADHFNANEMVAALLTGFQQAQVDQIAAKLAEIGKKTMAEAAAMATEWKTLSVAKGYEGKLPGSALTNLGLNSTWEYNFMANFQKVVRVVKEGQNRTRVIDYVVRFGNDIERDLTNAKNLTEATIWPEGWDPAAGYAAVQLTGPHKVIILAQLREAEAILKGNLQ